MASTIHQSLAFGTKALALPAPAGWDSGGSNEEGEGDDDDEEEVGTDE